MSTKLHDLSTAALVGTSVPPAVVSSSQNGSAIDLLQGDGNVFAVLLTGTVAGGTTVSGKVQDSPDGSNWTDIPGASFTNTTSSNAVQTISFARTARYARCVITLTGGSPSAGVCALIGQQKKVS